MTAEGPATHTESARALIDRFRAEQAAQPDRSTQALLLHECAVLEESVGEEPAAARDFLAAFNLDPQFREPLEALVRILTRRKSVKNLGKLLEALSRAASTSDERARALASRAALLQDFEGDAVAARECLEEAISESPEDPLLWLELEVIAAKTGDNEARLRALEARAELALDPTWKALLYVELAELVAEAGDPNRAYELLDAASALDGPGRYLSRSTLAVLAARHDSPADLARALEGAGELIADAIEDAAMGDATGVPRASRTAAHAADAWLRAAHVRFRQGETQDGLALVERAARRLTGSMVVSRAHLAALDAAGETARAAELSRQLAETSPPTRGGAALWLRVADTAASANDGPGARHAVERALQADPASLLGRALEVDLLADGADPSALAETIEKSALAAANGEARGRGLLLAAFLWATGCSDLGRARAALAKAAGLFATPADIQRVTRSLAAIAGDTALYEEATVALLAAGADDDEVASLWFELARTRLLRGDEHGGSEALAALAENPESAWLGRVLRAYALGLRGGTGATRPTAEALLSLAEVETDSEVARALGLAAALRFARGGDLAEARKKLRALHEEAAGDEATAMLLAELDRRVGDVAGAAATLSACAAATDDVELGAALHLEAALLLFRSGQRPDAIRAMEAAQGGAPKAAATMLAWALRGVDPDRRDGRLRALEVAAEAGADPVALALERFGLELSLGGEDSAADALAALETVEQRGYGDMTVAAALGRIIVPAASEDRGALETALDQLDTLGGSASEVARAERFRVARDLDQDRAAAVSTVAQWADVDGSAHVALEWLTASLLDDNREAEIAARRRLAETSEGPLAAPLFAASALVSALDHGGSHEPLVKAEGPAAALINLELAPPGSDPRRRSAALRGLGGEVLGDAAYFNALALAGWSDLAAGSPAEAREAFRAVVDAHPDDIASWEGVRACSEALGDALAEALACAEIGGLSASDQKGAELWERAGILLLEKTDAKDRAVVAFENAFERDPSRAYSFDKLFRHVRAAGQDDRLLAIIEKRLDVAADETELAKLYWERARSLRNKGDADAALAALDDVSMLEPDHVGAMALAGEIQIKKGAFDKAAPLLARLAGSAGAPSQQRLMSGVMAADLYEKRLDSPRDALSVLSALHQAGLATMAVCERLAALAAKNGVWNEATGMLEKLMFERDTAAGRVEAARLCMAIWRDRVGQPLGASKAVTKLLDEVPDDPEAVDLLLDNSFAADLRDKLVERAKSTLIATLAKNPFDAARVALLAKIAQHQSDNALRQATLGVLVSLGRHDAGVTEELARLDARAAPRPQIRLDDEAILEISDRDDRGPIAELFRALAPTISTAFGPSLVSLGVTKKERIDAKGGHPLRLAVASWLGAIGVDGDFDLYVGGRDPRAVNGIAGSPPAIVLGASITAPFDAETRSAVAREVFALRRGITCVRTRDDSTIASIALATCIEAKLPVQQPPFAMFAEVARGIHDEIPRQGFPRRVQDVITEICQRFVSSGDDPQRWAASARCSLDRMAALSAGDVSLVLTQALGVERENLASVVPDNDRARRLLAFVLSPQYLDLRNKLGMGVR